MVWILKQKGMRMAQRVAVWAQGWVRPRSRPPLTLSVRGPGLDGADFPITATETYIGRSAKKCQIVIDSDAVSRVHALIRPQVGIPIWRHIRQGLGFPAARYELVDQGSANGVYQGSRAVTRVGLVHGRRLSLGAPGQTESVWIQIRDPWPRWVWVARSCSVSLAVALGWGGVGVVREWSQIPDLRSMPHGPIVVVAADQTTLLRRTWSDAPLELGSLNEFGLLPRVLVGAEDRRYYHHWGVDLLGIARALWVNLSGGEVRQGGSTITQQLARTILRDYTGSENTLARKRREALAALKLEWTYSKAEILLLYLNNVYLGNGIYGFATASQFYFGKPPSQLDLSEAAILVGLLPAPNAYNPLADLTLAVRQRDRVLGQLQRSRVFPTDSINAAQRSRVILNPELKSIPTTLAPYYYAAVLHELEQILGPDLAFQGNFFVETSLDPRLQALAEQTLKASVAELGSPLAFQQGAIVTLDSRTGEILALVGGTDYSQSQFNRVIQAQRQPGSTFKIFPYAAALERGIPLQQLYSCTDLQWQGFFRGCRATIQPMTLTTGLIQSENVIALRLSQDLGLPTVLEMAHRLGIDSAIAPYPAAILGTSEVTVLELTRAFATLANQGQRTQPHAVRRIYDTADPQRCGDPNNPRTCPALYPLRDNPTQAEQVISPFVAQRLTKLLQEAVTFGTGRAAYLGRGEAGKTGTTTGNKDLWFVGYLPQPTWVTAVWLGNDDSSPTRGSSAQAAQIWGRYMGSALR
ncbi:MAG: transglycosylase domain-containing protein [Synechococcales cyanobacterium]